MLSGESTAIATLADGEVRETLLASYPDQCLLVRLETTRPEGLHCRFKLNRPAAVTHRFAKGNELGFDGDSGTKFAARARVLPEAGGKVTTEGETLVLTGRQGGDDHHHVGDRLPSRRAAAAADGRLGGRRDGDAEQGGGAGLESIIPASRGGSPRTHGAVLIDLGPTDPKVAALSTPERMELVRQGGDDPELVAAFFQMGRHLLVSSSRPGSLPPNLQGLWEPGLHAAWNGDFHLNINVQMNLWPANVTGLAECNEPLLALIKLLREYGRETAASLGCRGYAAGLASDAWGQSDWVGGSPEWDSWILGGHWAQEHLMEYYRFTQDKTFLQETAWPILQDGSLFLLDWLRTDPATGRFVSGPGSSPENAFRYPGADGTMHAANISIGNTVDHAIAWETFSDTLECAALLGIEDDFTRQIAAALKRVPPPPIGEDGRIMEWWKPFDEVWKGHRHKSHLYGLFPGRQITVRRARPSLPEPPSSRSSSAWIPRTATAPAAATPAGTSRGASASGRGCIAATRRSDTIREQLRTQVNENLFNRCGGPFQIDGNLGTPAGIAEMLVQSHAGRDRVIAGTALSLGDRQSDRPARPRRFHGGHRMEGWPSHALPPGREGATYRQGAGQRRGGVRSSRKGVNRMKLFSIAGILAAVLFQDVAASGLPAGMDRYNVVWDSPSADAHGSMPIGNGDIGLNAWVEPSGDLVFYISKTDAWDENGRLCKVGRVRVTFDPPLPVTGDFRQELKLRDGLIEITRRPAHA